MESEATTESYQKHSKVACRQGSRYRKADHNLSGERGGGVPTNPAGREAATHPSRTPTNSISTIDEPRDSGRPRCGRQHGIRAACVLFPGTTNQLQYKARAGAPVIVALQTAEKHWYSLHLPHAYVLFDSVLPNPSSDSTALKPPKRIRGCQHNRLLHEPLQKEGQPPPKTGLLQTKRHELDGNSTHRTKTTANFRRNPKLFKYLQESLVVGPTSKQPLLLKLDKEAAGLLRDEVDHRLIVLELDHRPVQPYKKEY